MSVLLTAVKKKQAAAKAAANKNQGKRPTSCLGGGAGPPVSNAYTAVWYWNLEGTMTTVMYTGYSKELWCNGTTICNSAERFDPLMGRVTDFAITSPDTGVSHQAHLVHVITGGHVLYVDGFLIPEHTA